MYLAPALLLMYGDVERTGLPFPFRVALVTSLLIRSLFLRILREAHKPKINHGGPPTPLDLGSPSPRLQVFPAPPSHLTCLRAIANDKHNFIRFANGLLNETTSLVGQNLSHLHSLKLF
jgi:hypothetical protein